MLAIKAYAKINLYLDVLSRYPDGYHQIESVMQSISLYDLIEVIPSENLSVSCSNKELENENNLALKAARLLADYTGVRKGASIYVEKRIPVAAGLAGGSADAAGTLAALNILWGLELSSEELRSIGAKLGADVPFCLSGGTQLAEGIGERLKKITPLSQCFFVIATPAIHVSTASIYNEIDAMQIQPKNMKDGFLKVLDTKDIGGIARALTNIMEGIVEQKHPEVAVIKEIGLQAGGIGSLMSGSGPSVFIVCKTMEEAIVVQDTIRNRIANATISIAEPINHGVEQLFSSC